MPQGFVDVGEAARILEVSPRQVQLLVNAGELTAERAGNAWLIPLADVERRRQLAHDTGRPLSQQMAWLVLRALHDPEQAHDVGHREIRRRVNSYTRRPFEELAPLLRRRADIVSTYIHPGMVRGVADDPVVIEGGRRAAAHFGAALSDPGDEFDLYVKTSDANLLVSSLPSVPGARSNVTFHLVDDKSWYFVEQDKWVWPQVAVLDLYDRTSRSLDEALVLWSRRD